MDRLAGAKSYGELKLKAQASAFLPGMTLPTSVTQAATRSRGGHGVINPVTAELAPKTVGSSDECRPRPAIAEGADCGIRGSVGWGVEGRLRIISEF
ncbi:hypothetical protein OOK52_41305 [Streptomyces sp. NBC_01565]|nr:hypothetical protein [Streptomyces sp. NBC_01565]